MLNRAIMLFVTFWLTGCSIIPEQLQLADGTNLLSYQDAASNSEQVLGQTARWGGVVAKIKNMSEMTIVEMVYYPLRSYGRPVSGDESIGRFRVYVNGFVDPMVYSVGRSVTFTGQFTGLQEGLVGEHKYVFPTIQSSAYHLWQEIQRVDISGVQIWPYDYWHGGHRYPYHGRIIIRGSSSNHFAPVGGTTLPKPVSSPSRQER
ncbi:MAG: outer membrane lipoprotein [Paraglaciecola sp.]|jgi:outer membrane lipoprotein